MAIAKVILNGETLMDVTSDTATANNMLSGIKATKNDGTKVTGNIASKSSTDLTVSGATVTAPAGYYANAVSKAVATTTHPNPTASIASSTGVVTASHTQGTGYVTSGTTTGTLSLTTQAGKTVTPTETAQTAVASYRWTTGPVSVAAISSTYVGTGVAKKSAADLTVNGSTVTAPIGYYSSAVSKSVAAGSAFPPAVTITKAPTIGVNTSGVVTASYNGSSSITPTVNAGYISQGTAGTISTTGTSTYQLTSQAAATYYPSTTDQTIASQRWLVGNQTIKSVTTSNLTAENIAEGVIVKVGDANNASRITQVTGIHKSSGLTCTMTGGSSGTRGVFLGSKPYYTSFTFNAGDTLEVFVNGSSEWDAYLYINNELILGPQTSTISYNITPNVDFSIQFTSGNHAYKAYVTIPSIDITENGKYGVGGYGYANVSVGGYTIDQIAMRSISGNISGNVSVIRSYAFICCSSLTAASFPSCTAIWNDAFASCYRLTTASFPSCKTIYRNAFAYCSSLTTASFPSCTKIYSNAFTFCTGLTTASFSVCTMIDCSAFDHCSRLTTVSFPSCTTIGSSAFAFCRSLTMVSFPSCTTIYTYAFDHCSSLTMVSFPSCTTIDSNAFNCCYNLLSVYLLGSSIASISIYTFDSTPIAGYTTSTGGVYGSIFVPASLYSSYLIAQYWSKYSSRIVSV